MGLEDIDKDLEIEENDLSNEPKIVPMGYRSKVHLTPNYLIKTT